MKNLKPIKKIIRDTFDGKINIEPKYVISKINELEYNWVSGIFSTSPLGEPLRLIEIEIRKIYPKYQSDTNKSYETYI